MATRNADFFRVFFGAQAITNKRLITYMEEHIALLKADNDGGQWTLTITMLETAVAALKVDLSDVDTSETIQYGATDTADDVMANFKKKMSEEYPFIARLLHGKDSAATKEFYPHGLTEYSQVTVEEMSTLTDRVFKAADKHVSTLGTTLSDELKLYKGLWEAAKGAQVLDKGEVKQQRSERNASRNAANIASHRAAHRVADIYAEDEDKAQSLCPFDLLYTEPHKKANKFEGNIAAGQQTVVFNETFNVDAEYHLASLSNNAGFEAWMSSTPTGTKGDNFVSVNADEGHNVDRKKLGGGENKSYLIIKNTSETNEVKYEVTVK